MPFPLHKSPRGLIELFRLRALGAQPNQFGEQVQPVVDVTEFYAQDLMFSANQTGAAGAFPRGVVGTVGTGAAPGAAGPILLYALEAVLTNGAAAGTWLNIRLAVELPGSAGPVAGLANVNHIPIAGAVFGAAIVLPRPLVIPSGGIIRADAASNGAGADHVLAMTNIIALLATG